MSRTTFARRLAEHPRLTGALFAATILLTQAGVVLAGDGGGACTTCAGP